MSNKIKKTNTNTNNNSSSELPVFLPEDQVDGLRQCLISYAHCMSYSGQVIMSANDFNHAQEHLDNAAAALQWARYLHGQINNNTTA